MGTAGSSALGGRDLLVPLWRAVVAFRLLSLAAAVGGWLLTRDEYPGTAAPVTLLVLMALWTAVSGVAYSQRAGRGTRTAVVDLGVTVALLAGVLTTQSREALAAGAPVLTSLWVAGPAFALALARGRDGGLAGALVLWAAVTALRGRIGDQELFNLVLFVVSAVVVGYAATTTRRATLALQEATATAAAAAERERLSRSIHDGVLQVLAAVRRRGEQIGGEAADLARLAAEQAVALRALMTAAPTTAAGRTDLAATLRLLATPRVQVVTPAGPVRLPTRVADDLAAVVREALANVEAHAGEQARAWVTVEEQDDAVLVTVRDDGAGIAPGRLAAAAGDGHRGVSHSIRGRVHDLGGRVELRTSPGAGTEWELTVPMTTGGRR